MGISILVIVLSLHKRLSIARAAFETQYDILYIDESCCKDDCIYVPRGGL
jgi:hypothetical protein